MIDLSIDSDNEAGADNFKPAPAVSRVDQRLEAARLKELRLQVALATMEREMLEREAAAGKLKESHPSQVAPSSAVQSGGLGRSGREAVKRES